MPIEYQPEHCGVILLWSRVLRPGEGGELSPWKTVAFGAVVVGFLVLFIR